MRFLLLSSSLLFLISCSSPYRDLQKTGSDPLQVLIYKPVFKAELYKTEIDVIGKHLSGLLLIKSMPDGSVRFLFSNEMGITFFDFEFNPDGGFKVREIIRKLKRRAVINTLRKDFELLLMNNLEAGKMEMLKNDQYDYAIFSQGNVFRNYITDRNSGQLIRAEGASKRKTQVELTRFDGHQGIPDSMVFSHRNYTFVIRLKRLER